MTVGQLLPSERRRREGIDDATRRALEGFVLPIWIGAGLADWWCFLERVPLMATVMLTVLHWDQARSVFGIQGDPDWRIKAKRRRLSGRYRAGVLGAVAALVALPYGEELVRCLRAGDSTGHAQSRPAAGAELA